MKYSIYSVKDAKTRFMPVTMDINDASAIRNFSRACCDPSTLFNSNPNDFALWKVGEFDDETGVILPECTLLVEASTAKELK